MTQYNQPKSLIIGAGAIGIALGYHLQLAGAQVSFLVRQQGVMDLQKDQVLYCHDDNSLKVFKGYIIKTLPEVDVQAYDYVFFALTGAALKSEDGQRLVKLIGTAIGGPGNKTKILIGSFFIGIRDWFLEVSGLPQDRVAACNPAIHVYSTKAFQMPSVYAEPAKANLIEQADWAYADRFSTGAAFHVMDDCPGIAQSFSNLYNNCRVSKCIIRSPVEDAAFGNLAPIAFAATELLGWPKFRDIDPSNDIWVLATEAAKEVLGLHLHGEYGRLAATNLNPATFLEGMKEYERTFGTFDIIAFSQYHHGGKVQAQDQQHLQDCIVRGKEEVRCTYLLSHSCHFALLPLILVVSNSSVTFFYYFVDLTTGGFIRVYTCMLLTFIGWHRALKAQPDVAPESLLPYLSPFRPYGSYFAFVLGCIILLFIGWGTFSPLDVEGWITYYFAAAFDPLMFMVGNLVKKRRWAKPSQADLITGKATVDEECQVWEDLGAPENERMRLKQMEWLRRF
ncbi:general amino acid permease [Fusarium acutatum]|uniref:General amino acid permease n=1 Tax=Fusarium acutatum TaxID=78861 RepID=A0A8H4JA02_9HYPO|nr:general amino acid permease [Fusarium acutatum]